MTHPLPPPIIKTDLPQPPIAQPPDSQLALLLKIHRLLQWGIIIGCLIFVVSSLQITGFSLSWGYFRTYIW